MAKIQRKNLDSVKRAPIRKQSYEAPSIAKDKREVPKEYQTFQKAPKGRGSCLWFLFLLFVATVAGFWYFSKQNKETIEDSIQLSVEGPQEIISGDQAIYKITYENVDMVSMQQLELAVRWPSGFYFDEASVAAMDQNNTTWLLEDLAPGQKKSLEIKGQLVGQKDDELTASFALSYQPENFNSDFKAKASINTKISDAKLELSIETIDKTLVATNQEIRVNFKNLTEENLSDLYIDILYPDDFEITEKTDQANTENTTVAVPDEEFAVDFVKEGDYFKLNLEAKQSKTMAVNGIFTIDSKAEQLLVAEIGNMVDGNFRRLARIEKNIAVINPKFDMDFRINGQNGQSGNQSINWGDVLEYQLKVTNSSQEAITDAVVSAAIDSLAIDWDSLETIGKHEGDKISWTKVENEELGNWPAGESRTFTWKVNVIRTPQPDRMVENIIEINIGGLEAWQQVSSPFILTIGESLSFNNGVYWDLGGRRVGSGLLPPQVNESTEYLVIWSLPQATGAFDQVKVSTNLPPQVDFISEMDIQEGNLEFDLAGRSLTWSMENFSDIILPVTASFVLRLTPSEENIGQTMTVLNATTVTASGAEEVVVRSKIIKTSDVISDSSSPIGIVE